PIDDNRMARRGKTVFTDKFAIQRSPHFDVSGIRMFRIDPHRIDSGSVRHLVGVIDNSFSFVASQEWFARDVANSRTEWHFNGSGFAEGPKRLKIFQLNHNEVIWLHIAQRQREQVLAFGLYQRSPEPGGFLFRGELPRLFAFAHLGANDSAVDVR